MSNSKQSASAALGEQARELREQLKAHGDALVTAHRVLDDDNAAYCLRTTRSEPSSRSGHHAQAGIEPDLVGKRIADLRAEKDALDAALRTSRPNKVSRRPTSASLNLTRSRRYRQGARRVAPVA